MKIIRNAKDESINNFIEEINSKQDKETIEIEINSDKDLKKIYEKYLVECEFSFEELKKIIDNVKEECKIDNNGEIEFRIADFGSSKKNLTNLKELDEKFDNLKDFVELYKDMYEKVELKENIFLDILDAHFYAVSNGNLFSKNKRYILKEKKRNILKEINFK